MIFLDTSAVYALADAGDTNHLLAKDRFAAALETGREIVTHNYVVIESLSLLQHRLGPAAARAFAESLRALRVEWVSPEIHAAAAKQWTQGRRNVSFVDQVSFVVMRKSGIRIAFAFDRDFEAAGFTLLGS